MDFGGLDGSNNTYTSLISGYDLEPNPKWYGSAGNEEEWRELKVAKISEDDLSKAMLLHQHRSTTSSASQNMNMNMLSFSSPNAQTPYYAPNTTGYGCMGGGPFTASQWMELEQQALIYKYITVNAPIPSNLLIPIRKALESAGYPLSLRHSNYGFHLGFSNSSDPEPGRCRRTDGKKWRCSRDAVADQKYCERHMNRGRHRSRKPVEGQTGHSVSNGPTTTTTRMHPSTTPNPAPYSHDNRSFLNKGNIKLEDATPHSILSPSSVGLKENPLSEFGLVCSDSLLNPLQKNEDGGQKSQNSLRQFIDDWPQSDRTQLSISIPMSSPNPISERLNLSPLRMGLGRSWIPWETSMGGPLGEVLHHSSPSALSLMTDSQQMTTLSPTGVLQKSTFGSLSNSSTGSSPRTTDSHLLGSSLITSSLPLL